MIRLGARLVLVDGRIYIGSHPSRLPRELPLALTSGSPRPLAPPARSWISNHISDAVTTGWHGMCRCHYSSKAGNFTNEGHGVPCPCGWAHLPPRSTRGGARGLSSPPQGEDPRPESREVGLEPLAFWRPHFPKKTDLTPAFPEHESPGFCSHSKGVGCPVQTVSGLLQRDSVERQQASYFLYLTWGTDEFGVNAVYFYLYWI